MKNTSRYVRIPQCPIDTDSPQFDPANSPAWIKFAELESQLQDFARTRAIFELGVSQSPLSMPELLWKAYIDFEIEEGERETARSLYERLIQLSGHVKVWISYALFEAEPIPIPRALREDEDEDEEAEVRVVVGDAVLARQVFERGYKDMKSKGLKSEVRTSFPHRRAFNRGTNYCSCSLACGSA